MIGTSVSLCIGEMARGKMDPRKVTKIISGTACSTPENWDHVISTYRAEYWNGVEDEAEALLRKFIKAGKIEQPRLSEGRYPNRDKGIWFKYKKDIIWY